MPFYSTIITSVMCNESARLILFCAPCPFNLVIPIHCQVLLILLAWDVFLQYRLSFALLVTGLYLNA